MRTYRVTIFYREPTFERRIARRGDPFRVTFDVTAASEQGAIGRARRSFEEMARLSSVGWVREIVRVEVSC